MSHDSSDPSGPQDLEFDRAIPADAATAATGAPACAKCNQAIRKYYYTVDGTTICSTCKQGVQQATGAGRAPAGMGKAIVFGLGAAIAGAFICYAVMEYLDLEIGIVAILIGFMVGYAIRAATAGRGGRRFQILGAGLTYVAVALAYAPFMFREAGKTATSRVAADSVTADSSSSRGADSAPANRTDVALADSATVPAAAAAATDAAVDSEAAAAEESLAASGIALGLGGGLLLVLALPVMVVIGSMPGGLISAVIIGLGMRQAWMMTKASQVEILGPFKVGEPQPGTA